MGGRVGSLCERAQLDGDHAKDAGGGWTTESAAIGFSVAFMLLVVLLPDRSARYLYSHLGLSHLFLTTSGRSPLDIANVTGMKRLIRDV